MAMYERILVATDGSELWPELAVHSAIELALFMQARNSSPSR